MVVNKMLETKLHEIMGRHRMKQTELAEVTGVSRHTIHLLYHDKWQQVGRDTIEKICLALNITPNDIFKIEQEYT